MKIEKVRKEAWFLAVASSVVGAAVFVFVAVYYPKFMTLLEALAKRPNDPAFIAAVSKILKAVILILPALSVLTIASGASTLLYLRKQKKIQRTAQNGDCNDGPASDR